MLNWAFAHKFLAMWLGTYQRKNFGIYRCSWGCDIADENANCDDLLAFDWLNNIYQIVVLVRFMSVYFPQDSLSYIISKILPSWFDIFLLLLHFHSIYGRVVTAILQFPFLFPVLFLFISFFILQNRIPCRHGFISRTGLLSPSYSPIYSLIFILILPKYTIYIPLWCIVKNFCI